MINLTCVAAYSVLLLVLWNTYLQATVNGDKVCSYFNGCRATDRSVVSEYKSQTFRCVALNYTCSGAGRCCIACTGHYLRFDALPRTRVVLALTVAATFNDTALVNFVDEYRAPVENAFIVITVSLCLMVVCLLVAKNATVDNKNSHKVAQTACGVLVLVIVTLMCAWWGYFVAITLINIGRLSRCQTYMVAFIGWVVAVGLLGVWFVTDAVSNWCWFRQKTKRYLQNLEQRVQVADNTNGIDSNIYDVTIPSKPRAKYWYERTILAFINLAATISVFAWVLVFAYFSLASAGWNTVVYLNADGKVKTSW